MPSSSSSDHLPGLEASSDRRSEEAGDESSPAGRDTGTDAVSTARRPRAGGISRLRRVAHVLTLPIRPLLRFLRHLPDRLRHARRRRRAVRTVRQALPVRSVLFVCLGNVCRSPYAEHVLRKALSGAGEPGPIQVRSAGFIGGWDRPSPSDAIAVAEVRGVRLHEHRSQIMNHRLVDATDLFVVTDDRQARNLERGFGLDPSRIVHLGDLDPEPIRTRTVEDPWGQGPDAFRRSYDRIDRCVRHLVSILSASVESSVESASGDDGTVGDAPEPR